jgi:hypothetical protein
MKKEKIYHEGDNCTKVVTENYSYSIDNNKLSLIFYSFGKSKPIRYRFSKIETLDKYLLDSISYSNKTAETRRQNKSINEEFNAKENIKIGTILYNSWGYEQTNIDFYKVVGYKGNKYIHIKELSRNRTESSFMSGICVPIDELKEGGKEYFLKCKMKIYGNSVQLEFSSPESYYSFSIWDNRPLYYSTYA